MKKISLKIGLTVCLCLILCSSNAFTAEKLRIYADPNSRETYSCSGVMLDHASDGGQMFVSYPDSLGTGSCAGLLGESNIMWAFRLDALPPGKKIKSATFNVYYITPYIKTGTTRYGPSESLYGIGFRPASETAPVHASDGFVGAFDTDNRGFAAIQGNWINTQAYPSWQTTGATGSVLLTQYLQAQYNAGAKQGDWIILRHNPETRSTATTRNHFAGYYYSSGAYNAYIEYELENAFVLGPGAPEITPGKDPVKTPIQHLPYFLQERELFGYNPRFTPGPVAFGQDDHFYIKDQSSLGTIDYNGEFIKNDFSAAIKAAYPAWNETFSECGETRVYIDNYNHVYLAARPSGIGLCLLHSKDLGRSWRVYALPSSVVDVRMECRDTSNDTTGAPNLLVRYMLSGTCALGLITVSKDTGNNLVFSAIRQVTTTAVIGTGFNSSSNLLITRNGKTHIVFSGAAQVASTGTPQYAVTYDRSSGLMSATAYIGNAGTGDPNENAWPCISIDVNGYAHVLLNPYNAGTGNYCKYFKSYQPNTVAYGFTAADSLPAGLVSASMVTDVNSTVHVVAADISDSQKSLKYTYKRPGQSWASPVTLVIPWNDNAGGPAPEAFYNPTLGIDDHGRLFVNYSTKRRLATAAQQTAWQAYNPCGSAAKGSAILAKLNSTSWLLSTTSSLKYTQPAVDTVLTDSSFFTSALNLNYPGLSAVKSAVTSGNLTLAKAEYAKYLRTRTEKTWWFDPRTPVRSAGTQSDLNYTYDFANRTGIYNNSFWLTNGEYDWLAGWDIATNYPRMYFLENIGRAYWFSGTEYPAAVDYVNVLRSWVKQVKQSQDPGNIYWSTINTGIRLRSGWPQAFNYFLSSPVFTDENVTLAVKSIVEQARHLRANHSASGNWLTFEMVGLYSAGVCFPELNEAQDWRNFACQTAADDMNQSYLPDGMGIELTPSYAQAFYNYYTISDLAEAVGRSGEFNASTIIPLSEMPIDSFIRIMAPDRKDPSYNDNSELDVYSFLKSYYGYFPARSDFKWVGTNGSQGSQPAYTSTILPYAGYIAMRSGWDKSANYLGFDVGPTGKSHCHLDKLNVVLWAYGRKVLFDSERVDYDDTPINRWSADTFSHNTVIIDNRPQRRRWGTPNIANMPYEPVPDIRWQTDSVHDFASAFYDNAYGMQGPSDSYPYKTGSNFYTGWVYPATHYRRVYFLKPDIFVICDTMIPKDSSSHTYDLRWHLNTTSTAVRNTNWVSTADSGLANLEVVPLVTTGLAINRTSGQTSPEFLGWRCGSTNVAATTLQHFKTSSGTVQFLTLLVPIRPGQSSPVVSVAATSSTSWDVTLTGSRVVHVSYDPGPTGNLNVY